MGSTPHRLPRLVDALRTGERVWLPALSAESPRLAAELAGDPQRAAGVVFTGVRFPGIDRLDIAAVHPEAQVEAFFMSPSLRADLGSGRAKLFASDYLAIARQLREGPPVDLAIAHLTPPDSEGWCDLGVASDFLPLVWPRARRRVAHLNPKLPRIAGSLRIRFSDLDGFIEAADPLHDWEEPAGGDTETRIAGHVAALVQDGDTLQFGVGTVPAAVAQALTGHRRLRFHGGMVSAAVRTLWDCGALDRDAVLTTGVLLGNAGLREFALGLGDRLRLVDVEQTHAPGVLAGIDRFVAVNGAIEVDLFGQVNAERTSGQIQAGAGGLPAFALGAQLSRGGRLVICLPSTARRGQVPRIVPSIGENGLVTLPRHLADAVVTEHGVALLRDRSLDERAQALIEVADPLHRPALVDAWQRMRTRL